MKSIKFGKTKIEIAGFSMGVDDVTIHPNCKCDISVEGLNPREHSGELEVKLEKIRYVFVNKTIQ